MKRYLIGICFLLIANGLWAQMTNSYGTFLHIYDARTLNIGKFVVYGNANFYSKSSKLIDSSIPSDEFRATNYWTVGGNLSFSYGIMEHLDASIGIRLYQDTNIKDANFPDDLFLNVRAGSFIFGDNHFFSAAIVGFRFPTGAIHNYLWSEFSSGAPLEYGIRWALSYYTDKYLLEKKPNFHFNLGYWNHNEKGVDLYGTSADNMRVGTVNSGNLDVALAFVYPFNSIDFRLELNGMYYLSDPDSFVYSNSNYTYCSPSIRYHISKIVAMDLGADFRVSGDDRDIPSWMRHPAKHLDLPKTYVPWKMNLGLSIAFGNLKDPVYTENQKEVEKIKLLKKIHEEEQKSHKKQSEIINIQQLGDEIDKEIEKLQKKLED